MCTFFSTGIKLKQRLLYEMFLFKSRTTNLKSPRFHIPEAWKIKALNVDFMCLSHMKLNSKILKVPCSCFLNMLGLERRAPQTPLYTSLHSIVSSPRFLLPQCTSFTAEHRDGASQRGRRQRRWWEGEGQMKRDLNSYVHRGMKWTACWQENPREKYKELKSNWWCGDGEVENEKPKKGNKRVNKINRSVSDEKKKVHILAGGV